MIALLNIAKFFLLTAIAILSSNALLSNRQIQDNVKSIAIEHIGMQDKPIFTLYILPKVSGVSNNDTVYVSEECYNYICKAIQNSGTLKLSSLNHGPEFGTFSVTVDSKHVYYLSSRKKSVIFFTSLINKDIKSLIPVFLSDKIRNIIKRLDV